ncbi:hypothetical protein PCE1_001765 [Barthelona sp. PCE]
MPKNDYTVVRKVANDVYLGIHKEQNTECYIAFHRFDPDDADTVDRIEGLIRCADEEAIYLVDTWLEDAAYERILAMVMPLDLPSVGSYISNNNLDYHLSLEILEYTLYSLSVIEKYCGGHGSIRPDTILINETPRGIHVLFAPMTLFPFYQEGDAYAAPETIFNGVPTLPYSDTWAIGCLVADLFLTHKHLFASVDAADHIAKIGLIIGKPTLNSFSYLSPRSASELAGVSTPAHSSLSLENLCRNLNPVVEELISLCCRWEMTKRPSINEILDVLAHTSVKPLGFSELQMQTPVVERVSTTTTPLSKQYSSGTTQWIDQTVTEAHAQSRMFERITAEQSQPSQDTQMLSVKIVDIKSEFPFFPTQCSESQPMECLLYMKGNADPTHHMFLTGTGSLHFPFNDLSLLNELMILIDERQYVCRIDPTILRFFAIDGWYSVYPKDHVLEEEHVVANLRVTVNLT